MVEDRKPQTDIGWYISDTHARRAIGYLTGSVPELNNVSVPRLAEAWDEALERTLDWNEPSPIGPEHARAHVTYDEAVKRLGYTAAKRAGINLDDVTPVDEFWPEMQALADAVCLREFLALVEVAQEVYQEFLNGRIYEDHDESTALLGRLRKAIAGVSVEGAER